VRGHHHRIAQTLRPRRPRLCRIHLLKHQTPASPDGIPCTKALSQLTATCNIPTSGTAETLATPDTELGTSVVAPWGFRITPVGRTRERGWGLRHPPRRSAPACRPTQGPCSHPDRPAGVAALSGKRHLTMRRGISSGLWFHPSKLAQNNSFASMNVPPIALATISFARETDIQIRCASCSNLAKVDARG